MMGARLEESIGDVPLEECSIWVCEETADWHGRDGTADRYPGHSKAFMRFQAFFSAPLLWGVIRLPLTSRSRTAHAAVSSWKVVVLTT